MNKRQLLMPVVLLGFVLIAGCTTPQVKESGLSESTAGNGETVAETPSTDDAALLRGDAALRQGDHDRALMEYLQAAVNKKHNPEAFCRVGRLEAGLKNVVLAQKAYAQALQQAPEHACALEGMGLVLLEQRRYNEAEQYLIHAVAVDPKRWRSYNGLGIRADMLGDPAAAAQHYNAALSIAHTSPMLLNNLGYSLYLTGNWEEAARRFNEAVSNDPSYAPAWKNLGLVYARYGWYDKALKALGRVMPAERAQNAVGYVCMLDGKYTDAERFFREAIRLSPSYYESARHNLVRNTELIDLQSKTKH